MVHAVKFGMTEEEKVKELSTRVMEQRENLRILLELVSLTSIGRMQLGMKQGFDGVETIVTLMHKQLDGMKMKMDEGLTVGSLTVAPQNSGVEKRRGGVKAYAQITPEFEKREIRSKSASRASTRSIMRESWYPLSICEVASMPALQDFTSDPYREVRGRAYLRTPPSLRSQSAPVFIDCCDPVPSANNEYDEKGMFNLLSEILPYKLPERFGPVALCSLRLAVSPVGRPETPVELSETPIRLSEVRIRVGAPIRLTRF
jgi:hypothetical protein